MDYLIFLVDFQLEEKQKKIGTIRDEIDQYVDRVQSMSTHLKNVRQERLQTQVTWIHL